MVKQVSDFTIAKRHIGEWIREDQTPSMGGFTRQDIKKVVDFYVDMIIESASSGHIIYFKNIGKIKSKAKPGGRPVRNPRTGENFTLGDKVQFSFARKGSAAKTLGTKKLLTTDIITLLEIRFGSKEFAELVHGKFLLALTKVLNDGARIEIRGLGSFYRSKHAARIGRNPKTGDVVEVPERYLIAFKAGRELQRLAEQRQLNS